MEKIVNDLLYEITDVENSSFNGAFNIRKDGKSVKRRTTKNVEIITKKDKPGIDIIVKENTINETIHIPVILTESGLNDTVYNDFYIGKNAEIVIVAGCAIHNEHEKNSQHDGIHRFFLEEGSKVKYIEKHYGEGKGTGKRILNPVTVVDLKENSSLEMESVQIKGVDSTIRTTEAVVGKNSNFTVIEKIMTHDNQNAKTIFNVSLNGENASTKVTSRSVATDNSTQQFESKIVGNASSFGHVECDAIIKDNGKISSNPQIVANDIDANLIHEAAIGKIANDQLMKLMTLGLDAKEAEQVIINGFLK